MLSVVFIQHRPTNCQQDNSSSQVGLSRLKHNYKTNTLIYSSDTLQNSHFDNVIKTRSCAHSFGDNQNNIELINLSPQIQLHNIIITGDSCTIQVSIYAITC